MPRHAGGRRRRAQAGRQGPARLAGARAKGSSEPCRWLPPQVRCLNEAVAGSCQKVFKPWERRADLTGPTLRSEDDDPELLLHVPFNGSVKLQAICIVGMGEGRSPAKLKARRGAACRRGRPGGAAGRKGTERVGRAFWLAW